MYQSNYSYMYCYSLNMYHHMLFHSHYSRYIRNKCCYILNIRLRKCLNRLFYSCLYMLLSNFHYMRYIHYIHYMRCIQYMRNMLIYMFLYSDLYIQYRKCLRKLLSMFRYMKYSLHSYQYMMHSHHKMYILDMNLHSHLNNMFDKNLSMLLSNLNMFLYMMSIRLCKNQYSFQNKYLRILYIHYSHYMMYN